MDNTIIRSPSLCFISNRFYRLQNNVASLNNHIVTEFSLVITMVIGKMTGYVTVAIVKTIVIVAYLPYQIKQV